MSVSVNANDYIFDPYRNLGFVSIPLVTPPSPICTPSLVLAPLAEEPVRELLHLSI